MAAEEEVGGGGFELEESNARAREVGGSFVEEGE
jgi:hypothetical protein